MAKTRSKKRATPAPTAPAVTDVAAELRAAHVAMTAGDEATTLAHLLAAWRVTPAIALADAIELVGARAARDVHPPAGVSAEDREAAWLAAAATGDPVMRHRLVATVTDVGGAIAKVQRLLALVGHRDPRVATKIVALIAKPFASLVHDVPTYWRPLFAMLEQCGDPRVRGAVAEISWTAHLRHHSETQRVAFHARIAKVRARLDVTYPDEPPQLAADDRARVDAIAALAALAVPGADRAADVEAGLLAAVHAAPADDGPRAIYADWLQERGDPRGELIALQLATAHQGRSHRSPERDRIAQLLAQHRDRWLGSLVGYVTRPEFERGFLAVCEIAETESRAARRTTVADPAWSTVRAIAGGIPATDAHPMPILASARMLDARALGQLASLATLPPLVTLGWRSTDEDWSPSAGYIASTRDAINAFARVLPRLPTLRTLHLEGAVNWVAQRMRPDQLAWPWRDTSIRELRVTAHLEQLGAWFATALDSQLDQLEVTGTHHTHAWKVTLTREAGVFAKLELHGGNRYTFDDDFVAIAAALDRLPADQLTHLKLSIPAKDLWTLERRRRMAQSLDRHPRITTPEIYGFIRPSR